jgi:hypothetical protein
MFNVSKCPPCEKMIEPASEPSIYVLLEGRTCRELSVMQKDEALKADPHAIICLIHVEHLNAFKVMVEAGDYPP